VFLAFEKWAKLRFNTIRIADNSDLWKTVKNTGALDLETKISCCFGRVLSNRFPVLNEPLFVFKINSVRYSCCFS
jgi:hypothetical protein